MELILVRHGQPHWGEHGVPQMDPTLTELGRKQAACVAKRLRSDRTTEVLTSPARRAVETAAPFAELIQKSPTVVDDWLELKLPDWSNKTLGQVADHFRTSRRRAPAEWWDGLPGGESFRDFQSRVVKATYAFLEARGLRKDGPLFRPIDERSATPVKTQSVFFGHGGTNAVITAELLGVETVPWEWERLCVSHTGITRLLLTPLADGFIFSLRSWNDLGHLDPEDQTL